MNDYPRCQTCKWFRPAPGKTYAGIFGTCERFPPFETFENHGGGDALPDTGAFVPGEFYKLPRLIVRPTFGCVQHEYAPAATGAREE